MKLILLCIFAISAICFGAVPSDQQADVVIVNRREWGAIRPKHPPPQLETLPPNYVIIVHTASGACLTKDKCIFHVRNIQDMHTKQYGWNDIGYNFLIGGDGNIYEGRGWDNEGAHTKAYNKKSLGIAFIGDFTYKSPTQVQIDAAKKLLEFGLELNKLAKGYKLLGSRQVSNTRSPGNKLYEIIQSWEHWSESP